MDIYAELGERLVGSDCVGSGGTFRVAVAEDSTSVGSYRVHFRNFPGYADQWYKASSNLTGSTPISVQGGSAAQLAGVELGTLATDGTLSVDVTHWSDGSAGTGGCMQVYGVTDALVGEDCVGSSGTYTVGSLPDGRYRVKLANFTGAAPTQWYGPASGFSNAHEFRIVGGSDYSVAYRLLGTKSITGRVVDSGGQPLTDGVVQIWEWYNGYETGRSPRATVSVGADGTWAAEGVDCENDGCAVRLAGFGNYAGIWYAPGGSPDAVTTSFNMSDSQPAVLPDEVLTQVGGTLTGTIVVPADFVAGNACVYLYGSQETSRPLDVECGAPGDRFTFANLLPGPWYSYALQVVEQASPASAAGRSDWVGPEVSPTRFFASSGSSTTATIAFGATISLTVRLGSLSGPVAVDGCIELWSNEGLLLSTTCDPVAGVVMVAVASDTGEYRLRIRDVTDGVETWPYGRPSSPESALRVDDGVNVSLTVKVDRAGTISGKISLPQGASATYGCVQAWDVRGTYNLNSSPHEVCADPATGQYVMTLPNGDFRLEYYAPTADVASRWSGNSPDRAHADVIHVTTGSATTIDVTLVAAGSITASIDDSSPAPVLSGCLHAVNSTGEIAVIRCLDGSNSVVLDSLAPGSYAVYFAGNDNTAPGWLGGADYSSAQRVTVTAGATTAVHLAPDPLGTLQVTVTSSGGASVHGGCVTAFDAVTDSYAGEGCASTGNVVSMGLPTGSYRLFASEWFGLAAAPLVDSWWGGSSFDTATDVAVSAGAPARASIELAAGGGTITVTTNYWSRAIFLHLPATGGCVRAYTSVGDLAGIACAADGASRVDLHVPAGSYRLQFSDFTTNDVGRVVSLVTSWSGDAPTFDTAASVTATGGSTTAYAASLSASSRVTGVATLSGTPVSGGVAELYRESTGDLVASSPITGSGHYSFEDLTPGDHLKLFLHDVPGAADQYYYFPLGVSGPSSSTPMTVPLGADLTWDFALAPSGSLSGVIYAPPTLATGKICVKVWRPLNGYWPE